VAGGRAADIENVSLRLLICGLLGQRYRYTGTLLGSRMERCERCSKQRAV
jgi:hypothetical protein